jgi:ribosomal protein L37AE/L43A
MNEDTKKDKMGIFANFCLTRDLRLKKYFILQCPKCNNRSFYDVGSNIVKCCKCEFSYKRDDSMNRIELTDKEAAEYQSYLAKIKGDD